jgi:soluble lytic murein transglycosylase-like protein
MSRLTFLQVKNYVSANNQSALSGEAIIAVIWKESSFDPKAASATTTATGLMGITKPAVDTVNNTTPPGVHFEHSEMTDPVKNIQCGTYYLKYFMRTLAIKEALEHYGTGPGYADNILTCERCLQETLPLPDPQACLNAIHT